MPLIATPSAVMHLAAVGEEVDGGLVVWPVLLHDPEFRQDMARTPPTAISCMPLHDAYVTMTRTPLAESVCVAGPDRADVKVNTPSTTNLPRADNDKGLDDKGLDDKGVYVVCNNSEIRRIGSMDFALHPAAAGWSLRGGDPSLIPIQLDDETVQRLVSNGKRVASLSTVFVPSRHSPVQIHRSADSGAAAPLSTVALLSLNKTLYQSRKGPQSRRIPARVHLLSAERADLVLSHPESYRRGMWAVMQHDAPRVVSCSVDRLASSGMASYLVRPEGFPRSISHIDAAPQFTMRVTGPADDDTVMDSLSPSTDYVVGTSGGRLIAQAATSLSRVYDTSPEFKRRLKALETTSAVAATHLNVALSEANQPSLPWKWHNPTPGRMADVLHRATANKKLASATSSRSASTRVSELHADLVSAHANTLELLTNPNTLSLCESHPPAILRSCASQNRVLGTVHGVTCIAAGRHGRCSNNRAVVAVLHSAAQEATQEAVQDVSVLFLDRGSGVDPDFISADPRLDSPALRSASSVRAVIGADTGWQVDGVTEVDLGRRGSDNNTVMVAVKWRPSASSQQSYMSTLSVPTANRYHNSGRVNKGVSGRTVVAVGDDGKSFTRFNPNWEMKRLATTVTE